MKKNETIKLFAICFLLTLSLIGRAQLPDDFPVITTEKTGETAPGYIFLTVSADTMITSGVGYYVFMIDDDGNVFKYRKLKDDYSYDFKVQPNGYLSYAQFMDHHDYTGGGDCVHILMDHDMNIVDSFQLKNGYTAEAHDFQLLPNGHVLAFGYYLIRVDLSDIVDGGYPHAQVSGGVIQELDQDKNVVWQWRSWDHYKPEDYTFGRRTQRPIVSAFHLNTINMDTDGHLFVGTPSWTKKINRQTGEIMWHLGGDENQFTFTGVDSLDGVNDVTGHAFYRLENGNVLLYDNGARKGDDTSEAHEYKLDEENLIAEKVKTFTPDNVVNGWHRGNAQRLPNGNTMVGWGGASGNVIPSATEFDSIGNEVFNLYFDNPNVESYRAVRFPYPPEVKYEAVIETIGPEGVYDFIQGDTLETGVNVRITDLVSVGYNELILEVHDYAPLYPRFEDRAPLVYPDKVILDKYSINYIGGELGFNATSFNISNPGEIMIYFRPSEDSIFRPLSTSYNPVKNEITAVFDDFGEFIFGYPDISPITIPPVPRTPADSSSANFENPVKLEWSQDGFFNTFTLQVAKDEEFNEIIINETGLGSTVRMIDSPEPNKDYYWRIKMQNDAGESDWSDTAIFTTIAPSLKVTYPNGHEVLTRGYDSFIEWETNSLDTMILDLFKDGIFVDNIDTTSNINGYLWSIPPELDSACNYHISIRSMKDSFLRDVSDTAFSINAPSCAEAAIANIELLSPNGGETFQWGQDVKIHWNNNTGEAVVVDLLKDGTEVTTLFTDILENEVMWTVDNSLEKTGGYRIMIKTANGMNINDGSNSSFTISGYLTGTGQIPEKPFNLKLYPNPANNILSIEYKVLEAEKITVKMYNMQGKELKTLQSLIHNPGDYRIELNLEKYNHGSYLVRVFGKAQSTSKVFFKMQ